VNLRRDHYKNDNIFGWLAPVWCVQTLFCVSTKLALAPLASDLCGHAVESEKQRNLKLSTKDLLALAPMKNAAKREM
jgi:hypothetical protein